MIELQQFRKLKISLQDYDYKQDVQTRLFFSTLNSLEIEVLQEILFSPLKFPLIDLSRNLEIPKDTLIPVLDKLGLTGLFQIEGGSIHVNKEMRKLFDVEMLKCDEKFVPGIEYVQAMLKKVPIQVLPTWYQTPRTAETIFDALIEKIFLTPQLYQRHLHEVKPQDEIGAKIFDRLFASSELKLSLAELQKDFQLSSEALHELILDLEFQFIGCLTYERTETHLEPYLSAFHEWKEHLIFQRCHTPQPVGSLDELIPLRPLSYAFALDLQALIEVAAEYPIPIRIESGETLLDPVQTSSLALAIGLIQKGSLDQSQAGYIHRLVKKGLLLNLIRVVNGRLVQGDLFEQYSQLDSERKAHFIYKHPQNHILNPACPASLITEKNLREIEKSFMKIPALDWIYFHDYLKGCLAVLGDMTRIELKKTGKAWRYVRPDYSDKEKLFIEIAVMEWLFESGLIHVGHIAFKPCFKLTGLGRKLFSQ